MTTYQDSTHLSKLDRRSDIGKRILIVVAVVLGLLYGVGIGATVILIRHQQVASVATNNETHANSIQIKSLTKAVLSCTQPQGKCFKHGQARTADAVASINEITIYAVSCAQDPTVPDTRAAISACVTRLIKENQ